MQNQKKIQHEQGETIHDKLILDLLDLNHIMRALYEGKGSQKHILIVLKKMGSVTQRALTQRLGIQPGSVSEVLSKLEAAGWIHRKPSEADRRTVDIVLTESGKLLAAQALDQRRRRHEEMFSCLSEEEENCLFKLLEKVNADWQHRYGDAEKRISDMGRSAKSSDEDNPNERRNA